MRAPKTLYWLDLGPRSATRQPRRQPRRQRFRSAKRTFRIYAEASAAMNRARQGGYPEAGLYMVKDLEWKELQDDPEPRGSDVGPVRRVS